MTARPDRSSDPGSGAAHAGETASGARGMPSSGPRPVSVLTCAACGASNRIAPSPRGAPFCGRCGAALPWVVDATESTFAVETAAQPTVVVDLWAAWCGPCRFVSPILEQLARRHAGRLKIVKVDVDRNPGLARRYEAMSIPTLLVMRDGAIVDRIVGALPEPQLEARIAPHLPPRREGSS